MEPGDIIQVATAPPDDGYDPRRDGESWEQCAKRCGRLLDQMIIYLAAHGMGLNEDGTAWVSGTLTHFGDDLLFITDEQL